ncbi:MAG: hypothetical protein HQL43_03695 [Alphaproteobacteria bacterium]|nr:hypothetical protein [Alphaproteobacteria bacterium]
MLFPAQEHRFTIPQIEAALRDLGLGFQGVKLAPDVIERFISHEAKPGSPRSLSAWHRFEQKTPHTFIGMYQFWCRKNPLPNRSEGR